MSPYLKNIEVANKYNVSRPTVTRWVHLARKGLNNLKLEFIKGKDRIIDNQHNEAELSRLANLGMAYKPSDSLKIVDVSDKFYKIFSEEEVVSFMTDLELKRQMKTKYSYAKSNFWNIFYEEGESPVNKVTLELLEGIENEISHYTKHTKSITSVNDYAIKRYNIIDVGTGNGFPLKNIINHFYTKKNLNKIILLDISKEILKLSKSNIHSWFPEVNIETICKDIEIESVGKALLEGKGFKREIANIIFHIGGTIANHDDRISFLKNIRRGMVDKDILIFSFSLDSYSNMSNLNYVKKSNGDLMQIWPLELIGIDINSCDVFTEFDELRRCKSKNLRLDKDYHIKFKLFEGERVIELRSGEILNVWRHYLIDLEKLLSDLKSSGLQLVNLKLDSTYNYALAFCAIEKESFF